MSKCEQLATQGFAVIPDVLTTEEVRMLREALEGSLCKPTRQGGVRNLLDRCPAVAEVANSAAIRSLVQPVLGLRAFPVRGILFDKTPDANWKVPWHQDLTIAVQSREETTGFGSWTTKDGVQHVQPPTEILEGMLAVRIHLDECGADNGPVRVIPGSHSRGRLTAGQIRSLRESIPSKSCTVGKGGVLLMRPLLLHASSAAASPTHRRVVHLEWASCGLPNGLRWFSEAGGS
ncbi:MAG: phytanoyl-CoA dioxygenase family protein [Bryobacteraceae bacterium]|nr:phytanoyl-CoA dioxygenase family protein [Bryobacteraceae bacterium]